MSKRTQVVLAGASMVVGLAFITIKFVGGSSLEAASVGQAGIDLTKYFLWGGDGLLLISALLYIRASAA
ncbi:MAG: hypothetical protein NUV80_05705 [Candidatus Berkelbacteria bacterium]|nr:hypothetical protein [Candidatus Berkelbacteria bacterium]MCR4308029.1 hypothetical protein [Candidatus Berkelbacteria bacterium]